MFTVCEISRRGGVAPHVIRYYARIGLLDPTRHPENGYRLFSNADVTRIRFIRKAQSLGYTLEEIRHFLALYRDGQSPCREVRAILRARLAEHRARLREMFRQQRRMRQALRLWEEMADDEAVNSDICHLIQAAGRVEDA